MTTDLFFHLKRRLQGGRPVPVPMPGTVMVSRDGQSFVAYPSPAAMVPSPVAAPIVATQQYLGQAPISPGPPRPFLEDVPLGSKANAIQTQGFDAMSTSEERAGGGNPRSAPASLVGGL